MKFSPQNLMIQNYEAKYAYSHVYISFIIRLQLASSLQMSNFSFKLGQISTFT